jgi:hypothetical protein
MVYLRERSQLTEELLRELSAEQASAYRLGEASFLTRREFDMLKPPTQHRAHMAVAHSSRLVRDESNGEINLACGDKLNRPPTRITEVECVGRR